MQGLTQFADGPKCLQQLSLEGVSVAASPDFLRFVREFNGQLYDGNRGCHVTRQLSRNEALRLLRGWGPPRLTRQSGAIFVGGTIDKIGASKPVGEACTAAKLNAIGGCF